MALKNAPAHIERESARRMCQAFGAYYRDKDMIVMRAWRAGIKKSAIAREMGIHRNTVEAIILKHGGRNVGGENSNAKGGDDIGLDGINGLHE